MTDFVEFDPTEDDAKEFLAKALDPSADRVLAPLNVTFTGVTGQASVFTDTDNVVGIAGGILLTSGDGTPPTSNTDDRYTIEYLTAGDADLDAVIGAAFGGAGDSSDANIIEFTFDIDDAGVTSISFDVVFASDEFPEFTNTSFVDIAAVIVNGQNFALFDGDPLKPLSVLQDNIDAGFFIDNQSGSLDIEYDGLSVRLQISAPVVVGENTVMIGVADTGDSALDSALFVGNIRLNGSGGGGGINLPPKAENDSVTVAEDASVVVAPLENDSDEDGALVGVVIGEGPSDGTLVANGDGTFTYTPDADFSGTDSFTYSAEDEDGALSDPATVTITVTPQNDPPVAMDDAATVDADASVVIDVLDNDSDVDSEEISITAFTSPAGGTLTLNADDEFVFTPEGFDDLEVGETETVTFSYTISDGEFTDTAEVEITVEGVREPEEPNTLTVFVGGSGGDEKKPRFSVFADGVLLGQRTVEDPQTIAEYRGGNCRFLPYTFELDGEAPDVIAIVFENDGRDSVNREDVNLFVDAIEVNGSRFEAETDGVYDPRGPREARSTEIMYWQGVMSFDVDMVA